MIIIFKKIPASTVKRHIESFVASALKGGIFKSHGYIEDISFWRYDVVQTNSIEFYALVSIEPDSVALRVIKQLNKKPLNGKFVVLQEYHMRHWSNDKRQFTSVVKRSDSQRKQDRRRKMTKTEIKLRHEESLADSINISTQSGLWIDPSK